MRRGIELPEFTDEIWHSYESLTDPPTRAAFARTLNPELQSLDEWLGRHKDQIPVIGDRVVLYPNTAVIGRSVVEDDAVVSDEGCELISRGVPVAAGEIEALMRSR